MRKLTNEVVEKIRQFNIDYQLSHGASPSFREIMTELKLGSLATVRRYVMELEKRGEITRTNLGSISSIPQLKPSAVTITPLVGNIACGLPNYGVELIEESYALPQALFGSGELFMLRAYGDSMIEAGIEKGDLLVIKKQVEANNGDIVVALVDGNTTLKRFYKKEGKIVLHPENQTMPDIVVDECSIQGIVISCIKMY